MAIWETWKANLDARPVFRQLKLSEMTPTPNDVANEDAEQLW